MTVLHHFHIGCSDDGVEVNVDLSDAELEAVQKVLTAYEAACPPPGHYSGPFVHVDDPEVCYRRQTYDWRDRRWVVVHTEPLPDDPACRTWWEARS